MNHLDRAVAEELRELTRLGATPFRADCIVNAVRLCLSIEILNGAPVEAQAKNFYRQHVGAVQRKALANAISWMTDRELMEREANPAIEAEVDRAGEVVKVMFAKFVSAMDQDILEASGEQGRAIQ